MPGMSLARRDLDKGIVPTFLLEAHPKLGIGEFPISRPLVGSQFSPAIVPSDRTFEPRTATT